MGLFERLFKTDKNENEKKDLSYIYKITELITNNNSGIINALKENIMKSDSDDDCKKVMRLVLIINVSLKIFYGH